MKSIQISKDPTKLDIDFIYGFLSRSYWAKGRTKERIEKSIANSMAYGVYKNGQQIGFARVLTDKAVFAYLMDVFIIEKEQGNGYAQELMKTILDDEETKDVKKWHLGTRDAHSLYKKFGFHAPEKPEMLMDKII